MEPVYAIQKFLAFPNNIYLWLRSLNTQRSPGFIEWFSWAFLEKIEAKVKLNKTN